jgi:hypothetical protein
MAGIDEPLGHFDREDDADRRVWQQPVERITGATLDNRPIWESSVRAVLACWDFRDPHGWRPLLAESPRGQDPTMRQKAEDVLTRFAENPIRTSLASATHCRCDVEYLLDITPPGELFAGTEPLVVRGTVDCLWQATDGLWHLLGFFSEGTPRPRRASAVELPLGLRLAAWAFERHLGLRPQSVTGYDLASGVSRVAFAEELSGEEAVVVARRALRVS